MKVLNSGIRLSALLLTATVISLGLGPVRSLGSEYGRLSGTVSDDHGNPLMGATVLVIGPMLMATSNVGDQVERVFTDGKGKFAVGNLIPGWYSLQILSPTRLPAHRNGIKVQAGQTAILKFALGDVFAPLRFQIPDKGESSLGEDWKWVLRTSSATRPLLRFVHDGQQANGDAVNPPLPASQILVGTLSTSSSCQVPVAGDPGTENVLAYLRPLSEDSDLLVVASLAANGTLTSSTGTEYRRGLTKGDPVEFSLVVHQFAYGAGVLHLGSGGQFSDSYAQGLTASYGQTRYIYPHLTLTAGLDVNYLNAFREAMSIQPRLELAYHLANTTDLAVQFGAAPSDTSGSLLERVGLLDSFPQMTLRGYRPELEQIAHSEISLEHRLNGSAQVELAAYHDGVRNAAVWGSAQPAAASWLAGNYMQNPAVNGIFVDMGDYRSSGYRAAYTQRVGNRFETLVEYRVGDSLDVHGVLNHAPEGDLQGVLRPVRSASLAGRVSAKIPATRTQLTTSYEWVQRGRVTTVDPYGEAASQLQPFFDVQVHQPLPSLAFLPARIEAVADFRNLFAQGYTPFTQSGKSPLMLSSAYRCIRGGFSVEF